VLSVWGETGCAINVEYHLYWRTAQQGCEEKAACAAGCGELATVIYVVAIMGECHVANGKFRRRHYLRVAPSGHVAQGVAKSPCLGILVDPQIFCFYTLRKLKKSSPSRVPHTLSLARPAPFIRFFEC
jgi:hypothetical protein